MKQTSIAAVWSYVPGFPCADEADKGIRAGALRNIAHAVADKGLSYDPGEVRPMTPDELSRVPRTPVPGVELRGLIYELDADSHGQTSIEDLLGVDP